MFLVHFLQLMAFRKVAQAISGGVAGALLAWECINLEKSDNPERQFCHSSDVSLCTNALDYLFDSNNDVLSSR